MSHATGTRRTWTWPRSWLTTPPARSSTSKVEQLEQLSDQLQQALDSRVLIEQAKGIIAEHHGITVDQAFTGVRKYARDHNTGLRAVAQSVVKSGPRM